MDGTNPYQAPQAEIETQAADDEMDATSVFSPQGRFGRLSYLAWGAVLAIVGWVVTALATGMNFMSTDPADIEAMDAMWLNPVVLVTTVASAVVGVIFAIRRFHDFNASGWWSVTVFVPLVNLLATLVLVFAPGSADANRFGPPRRTRGWEKVVGLVVPVLFIVGMLAAIAIPAYDAYIQAAREAAGAG